ncbi:MAG: hypothetical protein M3Q60_22070, partial [Actinomycetota bacterium]|nr:hypothetical protein [Actinomycetota bacterium]
MTDRENANAPLGLWQAIFGDEEGYLCVASGSRDGEGLRDFRERYFRWPARAQDAAVYVRDENEAEREVYFCAHLLTEERRAKATAAPIRALYADGDGARVPEDAPEPSVVVESSPRRTQLYWLLTSPVEPEVAELLNRRIARAVGADMSGWDLTQLLRVPGTRNRKYADAPGVSVTETTGELHDPEELDRVLPELPDSPGSGDDGELPDPVSPVMEDGEIIERCRRARNSEKFAALYDEGDTSDYGGDHSSADLALVGRLAFYTQDPGQVARLFRQSALMRPKWDEKRGAKTYGERTVHKALVGRVEFYGAEQDFSGAVMVDDGGEWEGDGVLRGVPDLPSHTVRDDIYGDDPRARARRGVFPVEVLPPVLRRMTEEVSREMNVPPEYFVAPALATLAVAIGGTRYLNVFGSWSVLGNLSA